MRCVHRATHSSEYAFDYYDIRDLQSTERERIGLVDDRRSATVARLGLSTIVNWLSLTMGYGMSEGYQELFPPSPRVIYDKAPLVQVVCQLRFPQLLAIEGSPPIDFQERIRPSFPFLERGQNILPADMPREIAQMLQMQPALAEYRFYTKKRDYMVTLTSQFLALSTGAYSRWEDFREVLNTPLEALVSIYKPSFFSRIGLRYQDAICRSAIGQSDTRWSELLRKEILGELALPIFEAGLDDTAQRVLKIRIPDGSGTLLWRHGLIKVQTREELCYLIDIDLSTEENKDIENAIPILNEFNNLAGRAFRWSITSKLRDALGPKDIELE